jgi:hypothetical protein
MPVLPVSAVDAVSLAIQRTKGLLFPFRAGLWIRLAILGLLTGEMSSSGSFHFNLPSTHSSSSGHSGQFLPAMPSLPRPQLIALIMLAALVFTVIMLVFMYLGSVLRFVLFEGVLTGQVHLRDGFRRWQERGTQFFVWHIVYSIVFLSTVAIVIGLPVLAAWRAGMFRDPRSHLGALIIGGLLLFSLAVLVFFVGITIWVFAKDFVVPLMALDGIGPLEGWRRLLPMLDSQRGPYAGYIGMKIVLALAAGILLTLVNLVLIVILLIPVGIMAVVAYLIATSMGIGWNVFTITLAVVAGIVLLAVLFCLIVVAAVPVVTFFQSYVLQFFGSRYERLKSLVYPEPPSAPPVPPETPGPLPELS